MPPLRSDVPGVPGTHYALIIWGDDPYPFSAPLAHPEETWIVGEFCSIATAGPIRRVRKGAK